MYSVVEEVSMAFYIKALATILFFFIFSTWMLSQMTGTSSAIFSPLVLVLLATELAIVIAAPATSSILLFGSGIPASPKGIASAVLYGTLLVAIGFDAFGITVRSVARTVADTILVNTSGVITNVTASVPASSASLMSGYPLLYGMIVVPCLIVLGFILMEASKG
jgi:hypothetical protein